MLDNSRRHAAARVRRGHHHAPHVPQRRERVPDQQHAVPAHGHPRPAARLRPRPRHALDHQPGPPRRDPQLAARGPPRAHRGGRRRPQAQEAQGARAAQARRHGRRTSTARATCSPRSTASCGRSSARRRRRRSTPSSRGELQDLEVALAVDDLRALQERWDELAKREREQDAELELARYRLAEKERELDEVPVAARGEGPVRRRPLRAAPPPAGGARAHQLRACCCSRRRARTSSSGSRELRAKIHQAESRLATRAARARRSSTEERADTDAQLKGHYSQPRRAAPRVRGASSKERLAAEEELGRVNTEIRARAQGDRRRAARARQGRAGARRRSRSRRSSSPSAPRPLKAQRAVARWRRCPARRTQARAARERASRARARRSRWPTRDVDKRVRVLEPRRRELDEARESARRRCAPRSARSRRSTARSRPPRPRWRGCCRRRRSSRASSARSPTTSPSSPTLERLVEQALGADLFCVLVEDARLAPRRSLELLDEQRRGRHLDPAARRTRAPPRRRTAAPGAGSLDVDHVRRRRSARAVEALLGDVLRRRRRSTRRSTARGAAPGARFGTADGHIVWPSGKITRRPDRRHRPPACSRASGALNELRDEAVRGRGARRRRRGAASREAEEALAAAQQDALELGQRLAVADRRGRRRSRTRSAAWSSR